MLGWRIRHGQKVAFGLTCVSGASSVDTIITNSPPPVVAIGILAAAGGTSLLASTVKSIDFLRSFSGWDSHTKKIGDKMSNEAHL